MAADQCSDFIDWLLNNCPRNRLQSAIFGTRLVIREFMHYRSQGAAVKNLPVHGFKQELVAHGQKGEVYRHLRFHIGCKLIPLFGGLLSYIAELSDKRQLAAGRKESAVEMLDNEAARQCGDALQAWIRHEYEIDSTRTHIHFLLHS